MLRSGAVLSLVVFVCNAGAAHAEGVVIDHKAVGCIVVGKYPKMNACFTPAADLARSRVYFRPEGASGWYYVEMKADASCFAGTLPKPGKKLVGKKIEYYVEAQNKAFEPARTAEFGPVVVKSAQECKKDVPVAPFLNNATVAVFPALPAGFVGGGIGTAAIVGIAAAGAAAAGTAVAVSSNNNDTTTTTVAGVVVNTTTTTLAPTTTTTTTLPKANKAPFAVLTTSPDPPSGQGPLAVTFDLCKSTDPDGDPLSFFFDFGDGSKASGSCLETHTYSGTFREASAVRALDRSYAAQGCVVDPGELSACRTRNVDATSPPPACPAPTGVSITIPTAGQCFTTTSIPVSATATGANRVLFLSDELDCSTSTTTAVDEASAQVVGSGPTYSTTLLVGSPVPTTKDCYRIKARAFSSCGSSTDATPVATIYVETPFCAVPPFKTAPATAGWSSDLAVEKGQLQVTVNGGAVTYADGGRSYGTVTLADGENRIEATLVTGAGKPGLWRFDLVDTQAAGTIRILAGDVASVTSSTVTFRLQGIPGERVAFTLVRK